jgi:hypothetical protein
VRPGPALQAVERYLTAIVINERPGPPSVDERTEGEFVRYARAYARANGISYAAWRAVGVDAQILERAGITT